MQHYWYRRKTAGTTITTATLQLLLPTPTFCSFWAASRRASGSMNRDSNCTPSQCTIPFSCTEWRDTCLLICSLLLVGHHTAIEVGFQTFHCLTRTLRRTHLTVTTCHSSLINNLINRLLSNSISPFVSFSYSFGFLPHDEHFIHCSIMSMYHNEYKSVTPLPKWCSL